MKVRGRTSAYFVLFLGFWGKYVRDHDFIVFEGAGGKRLLLFVAYGAGVLLSGGPSFWKAAVILESLLFSNFF